MPERLMRERPGHCVPQHALGAAVPTPRVVIGHTALDHRPIRVEMLADGFKAELVETAERGQVRGRERRVVHVEVFRGMVGVTISIRGDLDVYPRTRRPPSPTPSTAKSPF